MTLSWNNAARRALLVLATLALAATLLAATPDAAHAGATLYVSPSGRNVQREDGGGTFSRPFRSLGFAFKQLYPGDTLFVRGSAGQPYVENVGLPAQTGPETAKYRPATATKPIKILAASGHKPWIAGLLHIRGADHWTFSGINVRRNPNNATASNEILVKVADGIGWKFQNAEIKNAKSYANMQVIDSKFPGPRNWRISNNCIHDNYGVHSGGRDHNLYIAAGLGNSGGVVSRNLIFNAARGHNVKVGVGRSDTADGTSYVRLEHNTIYNGMHNVIVVGKSNHITMVRNLAGKVATNNIAPSNLRGYNLSGGSNVARDNYGFQAPKMIAGGGIRNGGGNRLTARPRFDNVTSCSGFNTSVPYGARA